MLSKIKKDSDRLINNQFNENLELLQQIRKIKNKSKDISSSFNKTQQIGQNQNQSKIDLTTSEGRKKCNWTSQSFRIKSNNFKFQNSFEKLNKHQSNLYDKGKQNWRLKISSTHRTQVSPKVKPSIQAYKCQTTIHSYRHKFGSFSERKYNWLTKKNQENDIIGKSLIEQPGFRNLFYYKSTLQQIKNLKRAKSPLKNKIIPKLQSRNTNKNKIKFTKYSSIFNQETEQCRPWSPPACDNSVNLTQMQNFQSLNLSIYN